MPTTATALAEKPTPAQDILAMPAAPMAALVPTPAIAEPSAAELLFSGLAPLLFVAGMAAVTLFGLMLAARAPDAYGTVAGFALAAFGVVISMRYFARES